MSTLVARETTSTGAADAASLVHTFGSAVTAGDLIAVVVFGSGNIGTTWTTPSGYTLGGSTGLGSSRWVTACYYKTATGAETDVTFAYVSGSRPIIIVAYRLRPTSGYTWDTVDQPNDAGHEGVGTSLGDFDPVYITDAHSVTATRCIIGVGLGSTTTAGNLESFRSTASSYIPPTGYTDAYPGTGTNTILAYGIASGVVIATKETVHWDGYRLDVTTEPAEQLAFGMDDFSPSGHEALLIRFPFPLLATGAAKNKHRYPLRRFADVALPYDLNTTRL